MSALTTRKESALRTVDGFIDEFAAKLPLTAASEARAIVKSAVADLATHTRARATTDRVQAGMTERLGTAKKALIEEHMLPVSRTAAANLPQQPELAALKMPRFNAGFADLVKAGMAMANVAEPHLDVLSKAGLPTDVLTGLRQAAANLQAAVDARSQARRTGVGATRAVTAALSSASRQIKVLDALVRLDARDDPSLLAQWKSAKHAKKSPAVHETEQPSAPAPASVVPLAAAATQGVAPELK